MVVATASAVRSLLPDDGEPLTSAKDGTKRAARQKILESLTPEERESYQTDCRLFDNARKEFFKRIISYNKLRGDSPPQAPHQTALMQALNSRADKLIENVRGRLLARTPAEEKQILAQEHQALDSYIHNAASAAPVSMDFPDQSHTIRLEKQIEFVIREMPPLGSK